MKLTPILAVPALEPEIPFFEALGFQVVDTVPLGDVLGFAILVRDDLRLMLQSQASLGDDLPAVAPGLGGSLLYVDVPSLDTAAAALAKAPVVVPRRTTFYGAEEIGFRSPAGHVVLLSQHDR